jgi:NADH dehydrogenase
MHSSNHAPRLATIFGGSGFVGRHVVRALVKQGWRVRVAVRRPDLAGHLQPLGSVGQIHAFQANLRYPRSVEAAVQGADVVVNLVGIMTESGRQRYQSVQAEGPRVVARAAAAVGARQFVHVSALGAAADSPSHYAESKARGEAAALAAFPSAVIMRPSAIFGQEDKFFNQFAMLARMLPVLPLIGGGETRFQPVYVGDVAAAIALAIEGKAAPGATYELGGPRVMSLEEIFAYVLATTGRSRPLMRVPFALAEVLGTALGLLPGAPLTRDQVELLKGDSIVSPAAEADARTLAGLGLPATAVESVVPDYLWRFRRTGQFAAASAG